MSRDCRSQPASLTSIESTWKRALARAGIRERRLYRTKRTFVSNTVAAGEPVAWIGDVPGVKFASLSKGYATRPRQTHDGARLATRMTSGAPATPPPATPPTRRLRLVRG